MANPASVRHAARVQLVAHPAPQAAVQSETAGAARERLPCVDALRGVMALCVAAYHFSSWTHAFKPGSKAVSAIALLGIYSVQGFFIISGLCFFHSYAGRSFTAREAKRFYLRRFFRIAPLYYGVLLLNLGLGRAVWPRFSWGRIFENVSLSFGLFHPNHALVLGGWSIGIECVFYLVFPLLSWLVQKPRGLFALLLLSGALPFALDPELRSVPEAARFSAYVRIPNHAFLFLLGALSALLIRRVRFHVSGAQLLGLFGLLAALGLVWLPPLYDHFAVMVGVVRIYGVGVCLLLVLLCASGRIVRENAFAPFRLLGELSYAVYLLHPFAWLLVAKLALPEQSSTLAFGMGLAFSLLLAGIAHVLLERPLLAWGQRLSDSLAAEPPAWRARFRALLMGSLRAP